MAINQRNQQINIYDPLPDGAYIRVLILEPGRRGQPLRCQLKIVTLEENPDFEAMSYVWGRGTKRKKVVCNGARVKITANLLQALVAVRYPSRPRTVWADSICINQNDNEEKGRQVALMGPIYNRARRVLIHLAGDDGGHAHGVATFVSEKVAMIRQMPGDNTFNSIPHPSVEEMQLVSEDPRFQSVKYLLDHPWFQRGWVVQEAVLARDAVVIWGSRMTARLDSFMICHDWLITRLTGACRKYKFKALLVLAQLYRYRYRDVAHRIGFEFMKFTTRPSLLRILDFARATRLKDPRDRVYAFLYLDGLDDRLDVAVDATSRLTIQPDYTKSVAEVYSDFARHYVKYGDIKWLHHVQHTQKSFMQRGFASWVPRWDVFEHNSLTLAAILPPMFYPSHPTSDNRSKEIARFDGNCLIVQGAFFDRVRACHYDSPSGWRNITLDDVASFWRIVRTSMLGSVYPPEHLGLALLETLTNGMFLGSWTEWQQEKEVFWQFLRAIEEDSDTAQSFRACLPRLEQWISIASWGRKLVATNRGYFALAPSITQEYDLCCIIFGCCFPFILREVDAPMGFFILREVGRPSGPEKQSFRVIGDAYVPGKHAVPHPNPERGGLYMPSFGVDRGLGYHSNEWETWGLEQGDIRLV